MVGGIRISRLEDVDRGLAWAVVGFAIYVAWGLGSLLLVAAVNATPLRAVGLEAEPGTPGWGLYLASQELVWGAGAALAAGWIGRRLVPGLAVSARIPLLVLVGGIVLAGLTTFDLHEWVRARYELFDPEYAGPVIFAGPAMTAVALAGWAALALPRSRRGPVRVALVIAAAGFVAAALPTLAGASDGVSDTGRPLALALGLDAALALATLAILLVDRRED